MSEIIDPVEASDVDLVVDVVDFPYIFAKRNGVVLDETDEGEPVVYFRDKLTPSVANEVCRFLGKKIAFKPLEKEAFDSLLGRHYDNSGSGARAMMDDMGDDFDLNDVADSMPEAEDLLESEDDAPIIRLINALLSQAIKEGASDIHIETYENRMLVRMRVDGTLREVLEPPRAMAPLIISRLKVMAKLDIAEKRVPQDGRISLRLAGRPVDVRVSTLPSSYNERIVLRLLDKKAGRLNLKHLGMEEATEKRLKTMIQKPHGIILVTGPTGSGKTTTLYASLTDLNETSRNIMTVEDPIEYYLDGIGQTQVNSKVDMSFARGLRAILRQDPDVVMIGEIRDVETAEIAVQASLTGHLVFSTLHTNTAVGAVTRLRDMGVEPYLLSSSLIAVIAQRLVRLLCDACKVPYQPTKEEEAILGLPDVHNHTIYHGGGCAVCNQSGYIGRNGIYELVEVNDAVRNLIHQGASEIELERVARQTSPSIRHDGARLILEGRTSLEEVLRVTREELQD
ncbi:type II secretion system ATPase GspE [Leucothrix arctica]|uniref:Type II secretion system protein E n=1 Tax=Leucothrix arctica TaxID=1481894 RepID=A0A317CIH2_9GAMM|nr:type II secretion system ATPase GspE [Leucothrix arctica]PWQ98354.1 type II secretion system protein GspE [Leucothrix arctica]